jgi:hypothetical protein
MSVDALKQAMLGKVADAPKTNENDTNKGVADVREAPAGRAPDTLDAKWGDHPAKGIDGHSDVYSSAVLREARDGRSDLLERLFDSPKTTASVEQALVRKNFGDVDRDRVSHSPMLQRGRVKTASADEESLTDKVMRVVGRR